MPRLYSGCYGLGSRDLQPEALITGHYKFGANELSIYRALVRIVDVHEDGSIAHGDPLLETVALCAGGPPPGLTTVMLPGPLPACNQSRTRAVEVPMIRRDAR